MLKLQSLFRVGSQYDIWEFVLEGKGEVMIQGLCYEVYEFPGSSNNAQLFNRSVEKVLLYFNADILERVEYYLNIADYSVVRDKLVDIQCENCAIWKLEVSTGQLVVINSRSPN